jgi:predicted dehydrogenase
MIRIGLLGASRIAPKAVIAPAKARGDVIVTAVAARDPDRARAYAEAHGIPAVVSGYEALAERDDVDLVYCALPPAGHLEPCLTALKAGKALLIEKPFAMNASQARTIAEAARAAGRPALEAFHYRFHGQFVRALEIIGEGRLGRLVSAEGVFEGQIPTGPDELRWFPQLGGGGTMDLGCYVIHALRTLIGAEPQVRSARAVMERGVDDEMDAELVFPGGVAATLRTAMRRPRRDVLTLTGEKGSLVIDRFAAPQMGGRLVLTTGEGRREWAAEGPGSYDAQLAHVMAVLRGEAEPLTGGDDAVANMAVIDALRLAVGMPIG